MFVSMKKFQQQTPVTFALTIPNRQFLNANVCPDDLVAHTNIGQKRQGRVLQLLFISNDGVTNQITFRLFCHYYDNIYYFYYFSRFMYYYYFQIQGLSIKAISEKGHRSCRYISIVLACSLRLLILTCRERKIEQIGF